MKLNLLEIIGWYGVIAILTAYALINLGWISISGTWYQFLNFTGGIAIVADALHQKNWQPAVLNIIWAVIAFIALLRLFIA